MPQDNDSINSENVCRICLSNESTDLITPCNCSGTVGLVHSSCLEKWASISCQLYCEICKSQYRGRRIQKYGLISSIIPFVTIKWNFGNVLMFFQASFIFCMVNLEIGKYSIFASNADSQNLSTTFLFWSLITLNFLVYFLCFNVIKLIDSWRNWRRSQFIFILDPK